MKARLRLQCEKLSTGQQPEPQDSQSGITFYFQNDLSKTVLTCLVLAELEKGETIHLSDNPPLILLGISMSVSMVLKSAN